MKTAREAMAAAALLGVLALFASLPSLLRWGQAHAPAATADGTARRATTYVMSADQGPRFALFGDEREISLVSHLIVDARSAYDPMMSHSYGVALQISDSDDHVVFDATLHTRARQSKAGFDGQRWQYERAFTLDGATQLTDDRVLRFALPEDLPAGATMELRLRDSEFPRAVVRAYRSAPRSDLATWIRSAGMSDAGGHSLLDGITFRSWAMLTEAQRDARARRRLVRMPASGIDEREFETMTVYIDESRPPPPAAGDIDGAVTLQPARPVAFTLWGPSVYELRFEDDCAGAGPTVELELVDAEGRTRRERLAACGTTPEILLEVEPEAQTLVVTNRSEEPEETVAVSVFRLDDASQLVAAIAPDLRRTNAYMLGQGRPIPFEVAPDAAAQARMIRVDLRGVYEPGSAPPSSTAASVDFTFFGVDGTLLERSTWVSHEPMVAAPLESVVLVADGPAHATTEPVSIRLVPPPGTTRMIADSSDNIAAVVFVWLPDPRGGATPAAPYGDVILPGARWRYAPLATRDWYSVRSPDHGALAEAGSVATLFAHTRLQSRFVASESSADPDSTLASSAVHPRRSRALPTLEAIPSTAAASGLTYTRLRPSSPVRLAAADHSGLRISFIARTNPLDAVDQRVRVSVGGQTFVRRIFTTRGSWLFPSVGRNAQRIEIATAATGVTFIANRKPYNIEGSTLYRPRTLHQLTNKGLTLSLSKASADPTALNVVLYRCGGGDHDAGSVEVTLDGGEPKRVTGEVFPTVTSATRRVPLRARGVASEVLFLTGAQRRCRIVARFAVPLGADIESGRHRVKITATDAGRIWARFFQFGAEDAPSPVLQWIEKSGDEGAAF